MLIDGLKNPNCKNLHTSYAAIHKWLVLAVLITLSRFSTLLKFSLLSAIATECTELVEMSYSLPQNASKLFRDFIYTAQQG